MFNMKLSSLSLYILFFYFAYFCTADPGCPNPPIYCLLCRKFCLKNETLVRSPCGCCYNQCVPKQKCPDPPIQCLLCHNSCPEGETLKMSPCGCCYNKCVKNEPACPPNVCQTVRCALPVCEEGSILVPGAGYCGCCPGCVKPKEGDKCYKDFDTGELTCGPKLKCCKGRCKTLE